MSSNKKNDFASKDKSVDLASEVTEIKCSLKGFIEIVSKSHSDLNVTLKDTICELKQINEKLVKEYENRVVDLEKVNEILVKAVYSISQLTKSEEELKNDKKNLIKEIEDLQSERDRIQKEAEIYKKQVEDYRNKTVVKITELQEKLDTANQSVIDKQMEFDSYVKKIEDERTREHILQQEVVKQKEAEYKDFIKKYEEKNKELERQLKEIKK